MIIDASVVFKWLVAEADSDAAIAWIGHDLAAPNLIFAEVANALWKRIHSGELAGAGAAEQLRGVASLVRFIDETPYVPSALELAIELGHAVYDCVYLAIAEMLDDQLLTADLKFVKAVEGTKYRPRVKTL